ncbi:hypothetical protein L226DRAFT_551609 [Lentinus tigrinus ALCF2SS1-7]|uniref:uncharacterized protein n=1 Tax=Lentinus tigrinus ALCF2SS1-7 TaxID=1328758 RepID=UPI001166261C|nr:hypothetical protein L226DRAFT_551609 [Lentinus tigrinus ALCF2SS1-7]
MHRSGYDYPDAFSDTHGTDSRSPFIYKTGPSWPHRPDGSQHPYFRELRPLGILNNAKIYFEERRMPYTAIMGLGWANNRDEDPFCPLLVTVGMEPKTVTFDEAKTAANYIKHTILSQAGFPEIDVAIWEWETSLSSRGAKLPSLDPLVQEAATQYAHPFASSLGLAIAPRATPYYEGTVGLYLRRGNGSDDVLALTAAHVARPPPMHPQNTGFSHHNNEAEIQRLQQRQVNGTKHVEKIATEIREVDQWKALIHQLDSLRIGVTESISSPDARCIGHVLHADPIGVSSASPTGFTIDWAIIKLNADAFDWATFMGNKVYIGDTIDVLAYLKLLYPNAADRRASGWAYPEDGLLQISGVVPESEIRKPSQLNTHGKPAMPVIKNGLATGTTIGWVNGLDSLVRRSYTQYNIDFASIETTIVPYGRHGAFSEHGDSGSIVLDRTGRDKHDVAFGTAWYELEPLIKKTLPGVHLY